MVRKLLLILFSCSVFTFFGCSTGKQAVSFKETKKSIDTLAFFAPHVLIESISKNNRVSDYELIAKLSEKIINVTNSTLKDKYQINSVPFNLDIRYEKEITEFFNVLDNSGKNLPDLEIPEWLKNHNSTDRYLLIMFVYGFYHSDYAPHADYRQSTGTSTLYLTPSGLTGVSIKLIVVDRKINKVLFYNEEHTKRSDPRLFSHVQPMLKKVIQPLYYK